MTHFAEGTSPRQFISSPASEPAPTGFFHDLLSINGHGTFAATHGALIVGVCALCRLVAAKSCLQKITLRFGVGGGFARGRSQRFCRRRVDRDRFDWQRDSARLLPTAAGLLS